MECVAAVSVLVLHCAARALPEPVTTTAPQPESETPPSVKLTGPVGLVPVTVAVRVTLAPTVDGLEELASVVVVGAPPEVVTLTVSALGLAEVTMTLTPYVLSRELCPTTSAESAKL